jgi:Uma2 family endonuclease
VPALVRPSEVHRLSIDEYHQLIESGGLDDDTRIELIDGLIVDMSPRTPKHENAIQWLMDWIIDRLDRSRYALRIAAPLTIRSSEPEPDLAIVERTEPTLARPREALLVIEVAVSSPDRDLRSKPAIYAGAVPEYWVVDLERSSLVVHRDAAGAGYADVTVVDESGEARCESLELGAVPCAELFAAAYGRKH